MCGGWPGRCRGSRGAPHPGPGEVPGGQAGGSSPSPRTSGRWGLRVSPRRSGRRWSRASRTSSTFRLPWTWATTGCGVWLDAIDQQELEELAVEAWRMVVPKLVAALLPGSAPLAISRRRLRPSSRWPGGGRGTPARGGDRRRPWSSGRLRRWSGPAVAQGNRVVAEPAAASGRLHSTRPSHGPRRAAPLPLGATASLLQPPRPPPAPDRRARRRSGNRAVRRAGARRPGRPGSFIQVGPVVGARGGRQRAEGPPGEPVGCANSDVASELPVRSVMVG